MFTFKICEEIELKILELQDAEKLFTLINNNHDYLSKWLPWVNESTKVEVTQEFIQFELSRFAKNNGFSSGIIFNNELVGCIGVHDINWRNRKTSIGYWLGEKYQGSGVMTRACKGLLRYLIQDLGINRVEIRACSENYKSRAIPERLGFIHEGTIRQAEWIDGRFYDHVVYGILAEDIGV
ncbi:GNAT family N-acetyltransferase [Paenibacillus agricola]|uniref:GNAT family N-acetyltransferase n=1 Tax=Paenibacillus agricola TaxID=2716264 RepID=A0ABX0J9Q1_9BACL|nr:GNAT family protein [Paenibacillus agricola]NHN30480.1 GNAT family N-acetyltransferase [Paenibacillus agricola]